MAGCRLSFYGKIFASMYEGTLYGQWQAIVTFQQMIVLADPQGYVDMTIQAIAARTSIPIKIIEKGIEVLSLPDEHSRTTDREGRRIELLDPQRPWGWRIINHAHYRRLASADEKRESDRLRIAAKREAERPAKSVVNGGAETFHVDEPSRPVAECRELSLVSQSVANVAQAGSSKQEGRERSPNRFPDFWKAYPRKVGKGEAQRAWERRNCDEQADLIIGHVSARATTDAQWLEDVKYIPYPATWINRDGWLDEYEKAAPRPYL